MDLFFRKIAQNGDRPALIDQDIVYTYHDLLHRIEIYAEAFHHSVIHSGAVTGIVSRLSFDSIALFFAAVLNKYILVPLDPENRQNEQERIRQAYIDYLVFPGEGEIEIVSRSPGEAKHALIGEVQKRDHAGLILFSSGTTGAPKVMLHDLTEMIAHYRTDSIKSLNSLIFLSFEHIGGLDTLFRLLSIGATLTIPEKREPSEICRLVEKHRVNVLPATPTFLNLLVLSKAYQSYDLSSLSIIGFGAEGISSVLLEQLRKIFPHVRLQQKFGTSETSAVRVFNKDGNELFFKIDDPQAEYKIVNNELWIKSRTHILGYLNLSSDPFEDGWFRTGDLVEAEGDYIRILGRKKDVINVGGEKVLPNEVEEILLHHPDVLDCKVYGLPNPITGQIVAVDLVLGSADKVEGLKEVKKYCRKQLTRYQLPVKYKLVEAIALSIRGKKSEINPHEA